MSDNATFANRLHHAVIAGWWTLLIWWAVLAVTWFFWLWISHVQPDWLLWFWGGGMDWPAARTMTMWMYVVLKIVTLTFLLTLIFLSLWSRRLRRAR